jgi:hypothetical protein
MLQDSGNPQASSLFYLLGGEVAMEPVMELIMENVRCFAGKHMVPIKPLTVLVGENSSGKTTLLAALSAVCDPRGFPFNPRFNEAPYSLGNFDTIASQKNGKSARVASFSLGYIKPSATTNDPTRVMASYKSNKGQVQLSTLEFEAQEWNGGKLNLDDDQRVYHLKLLTPWPEQGDIIEFVFNDIFEEEPAQDSRLFLIDQIIKLREQDESLGPGPEWLGDVIELFLRLLPGQTLSIAPIRAKPRRTYDQTTESFSSEGDHIPFLLASASSSLNFGVEPLQFHACVFDPELSVDAALFGIGSSGPSCDFGLQFGQFADAPVAQTLARQATQFAFGDVQPTSVFGRVAEVDSFDIRSRNLRLKRFIKRSFGVCVEVVAN